MQSSSAPAPAHQSNKKKGKNPSAKENKNQAASTKYKNQAATSTKSNGPTSAAGKKRKPSQAPPSEPAAKRLEIDEKHLTVYYARYALNVQSEIPPVQVSWPIQLAVDPDVEERVRGWLSPRGNWGPIDQYPHMLERAAQEEKAGAMTAEQVISLRFWVLVQKAAYSHGRLKQAGPDIMRRYESGSSLLNISRKLDLPPVSIFRQMLMMRKWSKPKIRNALKAPEQMLSARDAKEFREGEKFDLVAAGMEKTETAEQAALFEKTLETVFAKHGVAYLRQEELSLEQERLFGKAVNTPDLLFLQPIFINGVKVVWIDAKNYYLSNLPFHSKPLNDQMSRYVRTWGPGAVVSKLGFCSSIKLPDGVLKLDAARLEEVKVECPPGSTSAPLLSASVMSSALYSMPARSLFASHRASVMETNQSFPAELQEKVFEHAKTMNIKATKTATQTVATKSTAQPSGQTTTKTTTTSVRQTTTTQITQVAAGAAAGTKRKLGGTGTQAQTQPAKKLKVAPSATAPTTTKATKKVPAPSAPVAQPSQGPQESQLSLADSDRLAELEELVLKLANDNKKLAQDNADLMKRLAQSQSVQPTQPLLSAPPTSPAGEVSDSSPSAQANGAPKQASGRPMIKAKRNKRQGIRTNAPPAQKTADRPASRVPDPVVAINTGASAVERKATNHASAPKTPNAKRRRRSSSGADTPRGETAAAGPSETVTPNSKRGSMLFSSRKDRKGAALSADAGSLAKRVVFGSE